MELISHWIDWREAMGSPNSRQRRAIHELLEHRPMLMYLGDSWFSTPLYRNLARQSAKPIDGMGIVLGKPGGLAADLLSKSALDSLEVRLLANDFDVLIVSAGGNDSLSERLKRVFAKWASDKPPAAKISADRAFDVLVAAGIFDDGNGGGILGRYRALLQMAQRVRAQRLRAQRPDLRVIGHTYAPLKRIGQEADLTVANIGLLAFVKGSVGPWLWSVMRHVLADEEAGRVFARRLLLDGFRTLVLDRIVSDFPDLFSYADFSTLVGIDVDAFWYDEIHPNEAGFARMAPLLNDRIREALPPAKKAAVP